MPDLFISSYQSTLNWAWSSKARSATCWAAFVIPYVKLQHVQFIYVTSGKRFTCWLVCMCACSCITGVTWWRGPSTGTVLLHTAHCNSPTSSVPSSHSGWLCLLSPRWTDSCVLCCLSLACLRSWCPCIWTVSASPPTLFPSLSAFASLSFLGWVCPAVVQLIWICLF